MLRVLVLLVAFQAYILVDGSHLRPGIGILKYSGRIVGGTETTIDKFPYLVGIQFLGGFHCTGAIYRSNVIITAAQCVSNFPPSLLSVFAGTTYRTQGGSRRDIKKIVAHENFDFGTYENDIALLFLDQHLDFSETIQPIALASRGEAINPGTKAYIAGWGSLAENGNLPDTLYYAPVTIADSLDCAHAYLGIGSITASMICASGEAYGGTDSCIGDYGSPLFVGGKIYGFVSWGEGCARSGFPRVYSNVAYLRNWIEQKLLLN